MGNAESQDRPYINLFKQLLKAGEARISGQRLEELLRVIETYCSWSPNLGIVDLKAWEEIGDELRDIQYSGVALPATIWITWWIIRSVLEPLQTDTEDGGG